MSELSSLEPKLVWEIFEEITKVPRPSKKEGKIIAYIESFAKKHDIRHIKCAYEQTKGQDNIKFTTLS